MANDQNWRNEMTKAGTPRKRSPYRIGPKWEPKNVELIPHLIPKVEYDLRISLLADALYEGLIKLIKQESDSPESSE